MSKSPSPSSVQNNMVDSNVGNLATSHHFPFSPTAIEAISTECTHRVCARPEEVRRETLPKACETLHPTDVGQCLQGAPVLERSPIRRFGLALHPSLGRVLPRAARIQEERLSAILCMHFELRKHYC